MKCRNLFKLILYNRKYYIGWQKYKIGGEYKRYIPTLFSMKKVVLSIPLSTATKKKLYVT